jgi:hypothetical protein
MTEEAPVRRVLVLGGEAAGKTTFARWLGALLDLPEYDVTSDGGARLPAVLAGSSWIVDGHHIEMLDDCVTRADLVVLLDLSPALLATRVIWRRLREDAGRVLDRIPEPPTIEPRLRARGRGAIEAARDASRWRRLARDLARLPNVETHPFRLGRLRDAASAAVSLPAARRDAARAAYAWRERELPSIVETLRAHGVERAVVLYTWAEVDRMQRHVEASADPIEALAMWLRPRPEHETDAR